MGEVLIDTNILVYAHQPAEGGKYAQAVQTVEALVDARQGRVSAQILGEFMSATTRGRHPILTIDEAVSQAELLAAFRDLYFASISGVWERRSSKVAQTVVIGLYPSWDISQGGLDAADAFLADPAVPPALRRLVLEGRAGGQRSLKARAFDAS